MTFPERVAARFVCGVSCLVLAWLSPRAALADGASCAQDHEEGQRDANAGHLRNAIRLFMKCSAETTCPALIRQDCAEFFQNVKRSIPSVVFGAQDANGTDVSAVKVYSGDELVVDGLDGRAVELDPGQYHLRFVFPGGAVIESDVVVREGQKERIIQVQERAPEKASTAPTAPAPKTEPPPPALDVATTTPAPPPRSHASHVAPWIAVGAGVATLGAGTIMAVVGNGKKSQLDACQPDCPITKQPVYDNAKSLYLGADIAFGATVVAAGVATWLFIASRGADQPSPQPAQASSVHPSAAPMPGGGMVGAFGSF